MNTGTRRISVFAAFVGCSLAGCVHLLLSSIDQAHAQDRPFLALASVPAAAPKGPLFSRGKTTFQNAANRDEPDPPLNEWIEAESAVCLIDNNLKNNQFRRFAVLFGSTDFNPDAQHPNKNSVGRGVLENDDNSVPRPWDKPRWFLQSGFAMARGWFPIIRTKIVRAVSEGTTMAVRIVAETEDGPVNARVLKTSEVHVFLLEGGPVKIYKHVGNPDLIGTLERHQTYWIVKYDRDAADPYSRSSGPHLIPSSPNSNSDDPYQARKFLNQVDELPLRTLLDTLP